jgi:hypothetical protein
MLSASFIVRIHSLNDAEFNQFIQHVFLCWNRFPEKPVNTSQFEVLKSFSVLRAASASSFFT